MTSSDADHVTPDPADATATGPLGQPERLPEPSRPDQLPEPSPAPRRERRPLNASGWIALALAGAAFLASLLIAWPGAILLAALGLALSLTGVIRAYRGRATNGAAAATALGLAIATILLGFVWANRAQPCRPYTADTERFNACYESHTGLL